MRTACLWRRAAWPWGRAAWPWRRATCGRSPYVAYKSHPTG